MNLYILSLFSNFLSFSASSFCMSYSLILASFSLLMSCRILVSSRSVHHISSVVHRDSMLLLFANCLDLLHCDLSSLTGSEQHVGSSVRHSSPAYAGGDDDRGGATRQYRLTSIHADGTSTVPQYDVPVTICCSQPA